MSSYSYYNLLRSIEHGLGMCDAVYVFKWEKGVTEVF